MAVLALREAEAVVLQFGVQNIGIVVFDADEAVVRLRGDWAEFGDEAEVLEHLEDHLNSQLKQLGSRGLIQWMEDSWSNALRVSGRERVAATHLGRRADLLYAKYVAAGRTVPVYGVRAAAGGFSSEQDTGEIGELALPEAIHASGKLFAAYVQGHSMEPAIPDGSLCLFRQEVVGSRDGKRVLVEEPGSRFTIKRYRSRKQATEAGWEHEAIWLEPLNPQYPVIDLLAQADHYAVRGEFLQVLD